MSVVWQGDVYLSLDEARVRCGVSRSVLRRLIRVHGLTRYRRLGERRLYLRLAQLEAVQ